MPVDLSYVRANYVSGLQDAAKDALKLKAKLDALTNLYLGNVLAGTFTDAELAASNPTKHLAAADIATITTALASINTAITGTSNATANTLGKAVGDRPQ